MKAYVPMNTCTQMFIAAQFLVAEPGINSNAQQVNR